MKKVTLILSLITLFIGNNVFAQTIGENTFQMKYGFEEGLTQAFVFEASNVSMNNESQVLLALNSKKGTINTYKVDKETGAIGDLISEKSIDKKGTWAADIMVSDTKKFLMISYADYGSFEIFALNKDGSIAYKTYENNSFEKGIGVVVAMQESTLLVKSNSGMAWLFDNMSSDGKLGNITWQTADWDKGIVAGICCHGGSSYAALTHPDGKFWLLDCANKNAPSVKYSTDQFSKGINTIASNPSKNNFIMLGAPATGHQWGLKSGVSEVNVISDNPNWEKGLTVQSFALFQSKYGYKTASEGFLYTFKPEIGAVWVFKVARN